MEQASYLPFAKLQGETVEVVRNGWLRVQVRTSKSNRYLISLLLSHLFSRSCRVEWNGFEGRLAFRNAWRPNWWMPLSTHASRVLTDSKGVTVAEETHRDRQGGTARQIKVCGTERTIGFDVGVRDPRRAALRWYEALVPINHMWVVAFDDTGPIVIGRQSTDLIICREVPELAVLVAYVVFNTCLFGVDGAD